MRPVCFEEWLDTPIYQRAVLAAGQRVAGPAVIEEVDSTTLVPTADGDCDRREVLPSAAGCTGARMPDPRRLLKLLHAQLVNVCEEMALALMRTSYSPIFSEGLDFSPSSSTTGRPGRDGEHEPGMLGQALYSGRWVIDDIGADAFEPGDVVVHNDPYRGGSHMPEHLLIAPFFHGGALRGYVATIGHVAEIGGMAPGSFSAERHGGLPGGPAAAAGQARARRRAGEEVWRIMLANHRTPESTWGDFNAMIGALHVGLARLEALFEEHGAETILAAIPALYDYAEAWMRRDIAELPDGTWSGEDAQEDDGFERRPRHLRVDVTIAGDRIVVDGAAPTSRRSAPSTRRTS